MTGLVGVTSSFTEDGSVGVFKYPDGRISIHWFVKWDDGVVRCDCPWKKFHWDEACKHENARKERLQRNSQAESAS